MLPSLRCSATASGSTTFRTPPSPKHVVGLVRLRHGPPPNVCAVMSEGEPRLVPRRGIVVEHAEQLNGRSHKADYGRSS